MVASKSLPSIDALQSSKEEKSSDVKRRRGPLSPKPILDEKLLREALRTRGILVKDSHIHTLYQLLHKEHYPELSSFVDRYYRNKPNQQLPKTFLDFLGDENNDFVTVTSSIEHRPTSQDGTTTKLAIKLQDGHVVESVIMRHVTESGSRATLCVSSQVGCAMGCTFCATGTMGIKGNLSHGEILEQIVHANKILKEEYDETKDQVGAELKGTITSANGSEKKKSEHQIHAVRNIVFMGMGEPLNNYNNVIAACKAMIDKKTWNLAWKHVTVSTVGVTPKMRQLSRDVPEVNLALSLHAPNQPMREAIVPTAKMYPIEDMIEALDEHMMILSKRKDKEKNYNEEEERKTASRRKRAMIEYVMLKGDTSSIECAHQLGKLCQNKQLVVNLIPYNQTDVKDNLSCPSEEHMKEFQRIVTTYGTFCFIRRTMGADIAGACGQLVVQREKEAQKNLSDIEESPFHAKESKGKGDSEDLQSKGTDATTVTSSSKSEKRKKSTNESQDNLDLFVRPIAIATVIATSCLAFSLFILHSQRKRK